MTCSRLSVGRERSLRQKSECDNQRHHARENQQCRKGFPDHCPRRMARSRWSGLRFRPSLKRHDFALSRCAASLWFRRRARASHLAVISAVDLANSQGGGLGLAHRLESGSIVSQKSLCVWWKVIETTELGHHEPSGKIHLGCRASFPGDTGIGARGHGGPIGSSAQTRQRSWRSLDSSHVRAWRERELPTGLSTDRARGGKRKTNARTEFFSV